MHEEDFKLRNIVTLKNFVVSGLPGMIVSTLNMPFNTGLNMLLTRGKMTWTLREIFRGWTIFSPPLILHNFALFSTKNYLYGKFPYRIIENGTVIGIEFGKAALVGGISGVVATLVVTPLERIQVYQNSHQLSLSDAVQKIVKTQGLRGIYTGFLGTLHRMVLFSVALFCVSDTLETFLRRNLEKRSNLYRRHPNLAPKAVTVFSRLLCGGMIGMATTPFNTVRIIQQGVGSQNPKLGFVDCFRQTLSSGKLMEFWYLRFGRIGLAFFYYKVIENALSRLFDH